MSAIEITAEAVWQHIHAGVSNVYDLAQPFGVLSTSRSLRDVLDKIGVTVDDHGQLTGPGIYVQPTLDEQEN